MQKILLVEDDKTIAMGLNYSLTREGYSVETCYNAASALNAAENGSFDLAILDLLLPDGNGYDICRVIKEKTNLPVIFLTARDDEVNVVMGLDMGADDYITKPFHLRELLSRIRMVLRRAGHGDRIEDKIYLGDIAIYTKQAKVVKNEINIPLTALEYRLLLALAGNKGQVLTRDQLLEEIWDIAGEFVNDNTLTVYIKRLREKIEDNPQNPKYIKTVRGLGYQAGD